MGKSVQHWCEKGCVLEPAGEVEDPHADRAFAYWAGDFVKTSWGKRKNGGSMARTAIPEQGSLL